VLRLGYLSRLGLPDADRVSPVGMDVRSVRRVLGIDMTQEFGEIGGGRLSSSSSSSSLSSAVLSPHAKMLKSAAFFSSIVIKGWCAMSPYCGGLSWYRGDCGRERGWLEVALCC